MARKKQEDVQPQEKGEEQPLISTGETDFELPQEEGEDEVRAEEEHEEKEEEREEEDRSFRFKTQDEAEKAHSEAEKKMKQALAERDRALRMVENLSTRQSEPPRQPEESAEERIMGEAFQKINRLNSDDPDYDKQLAKIYARASADITEARIEEREREADRKQRITNYAEGKAKDAGLDSDFLLDAFWAAARVAPTHYGLDDQIDFAVKKVKEFTGHIEKETLERYKAEEDERRGLRPMSRGARGGPGRKAESEEPASLTDILKTHLPEVRRMRKEDIY